MKPVTLSLKERERGGTVVTAAAKEAPVSIRRVPSVDTPNWGAVSVAEEAM